MRAAVFTEIGQPLRIENLPDPTPGPGEVVIKVGRCGICATDQHMMRTAFFGTAPGTALGHEYAGEVVALGKDVASLRVGDRVAAMPMAGCGHCEACLAEHPYACATLRMMLGGFGEYTRVHAASAVRLPAALSVVDGALVEPLAAALRAVTMSGMQAGARVLVVGAGSMGVATIFWARRLGAGRIVASARSAWRESLAQELGADAFVVSDEAFAANAVAALGGAPDIVFECTGAQGVIARAIEIVRPRGTVVVEGGCAAMDQFVPLIGMVKEIRIQFSAAYALQDFRFAVDTFERGALEPRHMVTDTIALDAAPAMLETLHHGGGHHCKVMVDPWR